MKIDILHTMWRLSDEAVAHFRGVIPLALSKADHVIVATHVPPYREAAQQGGPTAADHFLPFFASRIIGDCLREIMEDHPEKRMTVYCGHAHNPASVTILDNLVVECAGAEYGAPVVQKIITFN